MSVNKSGAMPTLKIVFLLSLLVALSPASVWGQANVATSPPLLKTVSGCTFVGRLREYAGTGSSRRRMPPENATVRSTIPCVDGKLDGEGDIKFFDNGTQYWEWNVSAERGVRMVQGVLTATFDETALTVKTFKLHLLCISNGETNVGI
jgi:hypothetical protein